MKSMQDRSHGSKPSGLFIHEVIGHRLEGPGCSPTVKEEHEGSGRAKIMHPGLSIYDDPTLKSLGDTASGAFSVDDEGKTSES